MEDVERLERELRLKPLEVALHQQLAVAHQALLKRDDAESVLDAVCVAVPAAFTSLLVRARLREQRGDAKLATVGYLRAIKTAQHFGFWQDEGSTPAWLREPVIHAMDVVHVGRMHLFSSWLDPLVDQHGEDPMRRTVKAVAMYLGLAPVQLADPRQRPSFFYFPDLPVQPVFDRQPWMDALEAKMVPIREEMRRVRDEGIPFHAHVPTERLGGLTQGGSWDAYFFYRNGERFADHHAACPTTASAIDALPLDRVAKRGPEVCFSIMRPGAHILPHRGVTNTRAVWHLALDIPPDCALDLVDVQQVHWEAGKAFAFDDTFEHQAWNRSDQVRTILLGDVWNPHLTELERTVLAELIPQLGDWGRLTNPVLDPAPTAA